MIFAKEIACATVVKMLLLVINVKKVDVVNASNNVKYVENLHVIIVNITVKKFAYRKGKRKPKKIIQLSITLRKSHTRD